MRPTSERLQWQGGGVSQTEASTGMENPLDCQNQAVCPRLTDHCDFNIREILTIVKYRFHLKLEKGLTPVIR